MMLFLYLAESYSCDEMPLRIIYDRHAASKSYIAEKQMKKQANFTFIA